MFNFMIGMVAGACLAVMFLPIADMAERLVAWAKGLFKGRAGDSDQ